MASAALSRRVGIVVAYPPLSELSDLQRREFHEALLDADAFEDRPRRWQAAILKGGGESAEPTDRPRRLVREWSVSRPLPEQAFIRRGPRAGAWLRYQRRSGQTFR
jgi:hypothetical protein